ncbi:MAG: FtsX-like permease family protein [Bacteroidales bacterium]|nr:FtsX-like permease family protein [Bacteroidales bacterium]
MILKIAWKNIWRNKLRSSVVLFAVTIGLVAGIFAVGVMRGALLQRVDSAIHNEVSSMLLHNSAYLSNNESIYTLSNADTILSFLQQQDEVVGACKRLKVEAMINSGRGPRGIILNGIIPEEERLVTRIAGSLVDSSSSYFDKDMRYTPILLSSVLAEKLKVKINSKVQVDAISKSGNSAQDVFKVIGLYKTENSLFDEMNAFIPYQNMAELLEFQMSEAHEIAVLTKNIMEVDSLTYFIQKQFGEQALSSELSGEHLSIQTWKESAPDLEITTLYIDLMLYIFVGIILLALGFGIINTMLMVILERTHEIGMLLSIGMTRLKIYMMVMLETILLSLTGGLAGIIISHFIISYYSNAGINLDFAKEGFNAIGYSSFIYPTIDWLSYVQVTFMVIITGILSALYPAWRAIRLNPSEALRTE